MKICNTIISDEWRIDYSDFYSGENLDKYYYKRCSVLNRALDEFIFIEYKVNQSGENNYFYWQICFTGFPAKEYQLLYGKEAKFEFSSVQEAQDHVDRFLIKLNSLKVFL